MTIIGSLVLRATEERGSLAGYRNDVVGQASRCDVEFNEIGALEAAKNKRATIVDDRLPRGRLRCDQSQLDILLRVS
jgi:hypothetical protein